MCKYIKYVSIRKSLLKSIQKQTGLLSSDLRPQSGPRHYDSHVLTVRALPPNDGAGPGGEEPQACVYGRTKHV